MYQIDEKDKVIELQNVPQSCTGAPMPIVLSDEQKVLLAYLLQQDRIDWDTATVEDLEKDSVVVIKFNNYLSFMFGMPNDEALDGHPLYLRGLSPYAAHKIENSSWLRKLERMNSVHERHNPESFEKYKHFIFVFHDSTFECIAESFEVSIHEGSIESVANEMQKKLFDEFRFELR